MDKFNFELNARVEVIRQDGIYKSTVQDVSDENLYITLPVYKGEYLDLEIGHYFQAYYYDKKKNVYDFKAKVINKVKRDDLILYEVENPKDIKKIQRRDFFRVDVVNQIYFYKFDEDGKAQKCSGLTIDLSGGGLRLKCKEELKLNCIISLNLLDEDEVINVKGKVIRSHISSDSDNIYGISFWQINDRLRERIIRMIFKIMQRQRELV